MLDYLTITVSQTPLNVYVSSHKNSNFKEKVALQIVTKVAFKISCYRELNRALTFPGETQVENKSFMHIVWTGQSHRTGVRASHWQEGMRIVSLPGSGPGAGCRLPRKGTVSLAISLGDLAAVSSTDSRGTLWGTGGLGLAQAGPLVRGAGHEGVGAAMHHPGVQAVGHGEGLEVAPQGQGQWELVHQVHGCAGHHGAAAQVLQAQHLAGPPEPVHAVPQQHDSGQLCEGLCDVEIAQRADLEEGHTQPLSIGTGLLGGHLPLECQVQAVPHQDPGHTRCVLIDLLNPSVDAIEGPAVCNVVDQDHTLCAPGVGAEYGTESSLP